MKQKTLFEDNLNKNKPLADRIRPKNFSEFVGQQHLVAKGKFLREMIESDNLSSMIFWGPPGVGKTTLAEIIAHSTNSNFVRFSAVMNGIKEIREIMKEAEQNFTNKTIVFIDEIHRFNKAQQDAFLPYVENGSIILIGATTENPSFEINSALLSRTRVFVLKQIDKEEIENLLNDVVNKQKIIENVQIDVSKDIIKKISLHSNGDVRTALNTLEMLVLNSEKIDNKVKIQEKLVSDILATRTLHYDKDGEEHYNVISALHKSMRNSDVDSAIYWLGRMLEGGDDPVYIARRLVRFASEDIGLADNAALNLAINTFQACQFLGLPECDVHLTQCVIYLSVAPKSNAAYKARIAVQTDIKKSINDPVPLHLRNATTKLMKEIGYGKGYQLAHLYDDKLTTMPTRPDSVKDNIYYIPTEKGNEKKIKDKMNYIKNWKENHSTNFLA
ncbi:replication-associated recombination protein A [Candidatus Gracilibacteria bacterium]|nr:replication-associated recombination protein A [Candidatus Gracilibacteria bacterium]